MPNTIGNLIRAKYSCLDYARNILHLPVSRDGDRCTSIAPGPHSHNDAFVIHNDWWIDYSSGKYGDVIDLCAEAKYNGDKKAAFRELGSEFFSQPQANYYQHIQALDSLISRWHSSLRQCDRDYLHSRRISDETIDRLKIGYCPDTKSSFYDRVIIPYWQNGLPVYYAGRDASGQWKFKESKRSKYKKAWTGKNEYSENIMWGLHTLAHDWCGNTNSDEQAAKRDEYLCILEGQFDAMSFEQEHWHVLSPIGGHFSGKLMKLLASICQEYKKIFICFDNDPAGQKFQLKMARFLFSHNIPFVCGHTQNPDGTPAKYDVSDYYSHGGSLDELVASAIPGVYELAQSFTQGQEEDFREFLLTAGRYASESQLEILRSKCPLDADFVKACVKEAKRPPSERDIVDQLVKEHELTFQVGEGFYEYQHGVWNALPALAVEGYARELLGRHAISGRMSSCARHVQAIRWRDTPFNQSGHINLMNGMLDPVTGELSEHNPALYSNIQIPRIYDPLAVAPRFSQFLDEITGNDKQKRRLILQMMGSAFIRDARFQTGFMLMGNGANGKSVLIEIMRYVLDPRNCSDVDLSKFADPFEPLRLRHSLVNFCTETRVDLKGGEAAIKRVLSGETISAARKGVDAVEFAPTCKVICACNNFVASKDISYGFARKWKFIGFNQIFKDRDADLHLLDELKKEAAGIFNMMLEGYRDLIASGGYVTTDEEEQIRRDFMIQANPVTMFIGTELDDLHGTYSVSALYETHYIPWTEKARTGVLSLPNFGAVMKKLMPQIRPDVKFVAKRWANTWVFPDEPETPQDRLPGDYTRPERRTPPASQPAPVPEMPAPEIGEPEQSTPVAAPVSTSRKYPMTENQIGLANAIVASMKQAGINPGTPGSGNEWTTWDKQKSFGKSYSADSRGWCKAWERLKYALWENGYPSSTRHAIMYRVIFDEFNMYRADADPDPVIRALKEHPEYI